MSKGKGNRLAGNLMLALAAFVWGIAFVFQRTGMDHIGPLVFNGLRMALAAAALAVLLLILNGREGLHFDKKTLKAGVICGLFMTGGNLLQQVGLKYTAAGKAGFITALYIILVPLIRAVFLREKASAAAWSGVIIGAFGLYLLCVREGFTVTAGDLWVLGCALMFALQIIAIGRFVADCDPVKISFIQFAVNTAVSLVLACFTELGETSLSGISDAMGAIVYCGLFSGALGYTLQMIGQKKTDSTAASMIMSFESVFAALAGWVMLHETMSVRELCGCAIMFAAVIIIQIKD